MAAPKRRERVFQNNAWETCYQQYLASFPSETTRKSYHYILRGFFCDPKKPPSAYTRADVEAYISSPVRADNRSDKGAPVSVNWRNNRLGVLCSFYSWCKQYKVKFRDKLTPILHGDKPTDGIKQARKPKTDRSITDEEIERFFSCIGKTPPELRDRALFLTLLLTGRRKSEIATLRWRDLEQTTIVENGHMRAGWIVHFRGKGRLSRDDTQEFHAVIIDAIKAFFESVDLWEQMQPDQPLFPATRSWRKPGEPMNSSHINRRFALYARRAGLPETVVVHSFRGASAWARYCANGHDILAVQADLRHSSVQVTLGYIEPYQKRQRADTTMAALAAKYGHL